MSIKKFNKLLVTIWIISLVSTFLVIHLSYKKMEPLQESVKALIKLNEQFHNLSLLGNELIFYSKQSSERRWLNKIYDLKTEIEKLNKQSFTKDDRFYLDKLLSLINDVVQIHKSFHTYEKNFFSGDKKVTKYFLLQASNMFGITSQMNKVITTVKTHKMKELEKQEKIIKVIIYSIVVFKLFLALGTFFYIWRNIVKPLVGISDSLHVSDNLANVPQIIYSGANEISIIVAKLNDSIEKTKEEFKKSEEHKLMLEHSYVELESINQELKESEKAINIINESLEEKVKEKTKELQRLNKELQDEVEKKTEENFQQFQMLQQQSKMASMGEMIGAIAHQWRQPLNEISIRIQKLKYAYSNNEVNEEYLESFIQKNKDTIKFMSKTIDNFRNFFRIDKNKMIFEVKASIEELIEMQSAQLTNHNIFVSIKGKEFQIEGFKTEFQQVILNIISNAKDVFIAKQVPDPEIDIYLDTHSILIEDNGGGIPQDIIERIFEPYFTTKDQGEGTGMGLYISKMIIEQNMEGLIEVKNGPRGAVFKIDFKDIVKG